MIILVPTKCVCLHVLISVDWTCIDQHTEFINHPPRDMEGVESFEKRKRSGSGSDEELTGKRAAGTEDPNDDILKLKRVYGQFSIETIHERRKRNREFSGLFFSVLLIRIGKQNVKGVSTFLHRLRN